jgi:hypothetical protein
VDFARVCTVGEKGVVVAPGALFEVLGDSLVTIKGNSDRQALRRLGVGGESGRGRQKDQVHGLEELALSILIEVCSPAGKRLCA